MIVLDEHFQRTDVRAAFARWYGGSVRNIIEIRPGTVIKDDAIPPLLLGLSSPTFVTLNWPHFWNSACAHRGYCIVCFNLHTDEIPESPALLRRLFRLESFRTKRARMGKVARISGGVVGYYQVRDSAVYAVPLR